MKTCSIEFNIYLLLLLGLAAGCQTTDEKEISAVRLHIEVNSDAGGSSKPIPIYRAQPILVNVEQSPFLDERDVENATVIEWMDGFAIQLQFNRHGTLMLENMTRANPNRRIAIMSDFGEIRWLAAPLIGRPINDGLLTFTPDASRAEAERIVSGLNKVAAILKKKTHF